MIIKTPGVNHLCRFYAIMLQLKTALIRPFCYFKLAASGFTPSYFSLVNYFEKNQLTAPYKAPF